MKIHSWILIGLIFFAGCASSSKVTDFQGLSTPDGNPVARIYVSRTAFHILGKIPLFGNASVYRTTQDFLTHAKRLGASEVRMDHTAKTYYWFGLPPFTLVLTPVTTTVSGDALKS
jgi:hypothetical protein